jgi:hypothetical protein
MRIRAIIVIVGAHDARNAALSADDAAPDESCRPIVRRSVPAGR